MIIDVFEKTQEEIYQERADVLCRAGDNLSDALDKLHKIENVLHNKLKSSEKSSFDNAVYDKEILLHEINTITAQYNRAREKAKLQYYYMIVTREALGLRNHKWVEEVYKIPPARKPIRHI